MHLLALRYYRYTWFLTLVSVVLTNFLVAYAATRPATDADRAAIEAAGITYTRGMSWDPDNKYAGDEVAAATQFLLARNGTGTRGTWCYNGDQTMRITKLNPQFRIGLAKALAEIERQYGGRNIVQSGFRCDGSGGNHPRGCAADIIWASCKAKGGDGWRCSSDRFDAPEQRWIDANGKNAPYNIHLRLRYAPEGHHVEPVNTAGCRTGATVGSAPSAGASPSSGIANALRSFLNPPPSPSPVAPSQPLAQSQQPQLQQKPELGIENKTVYAVGTCPPQFYCANDTYYYRASTCVDQVQKKCPSGCSKTGSTCAATSTSEMSAFEKIETIAGPEAEEVGTVSDRLLELAISGEDIATLKDTSTTTSAQDTPYVPPPPLSEQTFISYDLRYAPADQNSKQEMSAMQRVLTAMQDTLLRVLAYLRPFGTSQRSQPHETTEYAEYEY